MNPKGRYHQYRAIVLARHLVRIAFDSDFEAVNDRFQISLANQRALTPVLPRDNPVYRSLYGSASRISLFRHLSETIQTSGLTVSQMAFLDLRRFRGLIVAVTLSRAL